MIISWIKKLAAKVYGTTHTPELVKPSAPWEMLSSTQNAPPKAPIDAWRESLETVWEGQQTVSFLYFDRDGDGENRTVLLEKILSASRNRLYFYGFCHVRNAYRRFAAHRIRGDLVNSETGEVYSPEVFLATLGIRMEPVEPPEPSGENRDNTPFYSELPINPEKWWEEECRRQTEKTERLIEKESETWKIIWQGEIAIHFGYLNGPSRFRTDLTMTRLLLGRKNNLFLHGFCSHSNCERTFFLREVRSKIRVYQAKRYFFGDEFLDFLLNQYTVPEQPPPKKERPPRLPSEEIQRRNTERRAAMRAKSVTPEVLEAAKKIIDALHDDIPDGHKLRGLDRTKYYAIELVPGGCLCRFHYKTKYPRFEIHGEKPVRVEGFSEILSFLPALRQSVRAAVENGSRQ